MNTGLSRSKSPITSRSKPLIMAVASLVFSTALLSGCTTARQMLFDNGTVSKKVFRAYLNMPQTAEVDENSVRAAALESLPVGVTEDQIYGYLNCHFVSRSSKNAMAFYDLKNQDNEIICSLSYNPDPGLRTTYHIKFLLSDQKVLKDVSVTMSQVSI